MKEFLFLTMVAMEIGKGLFFSCHSKGCYEEKKLNQKLDSYKFKLSLKKMSWLDQCKLR